MAEACGASDMESRAGEALGLVLRADGDATWALLILAMAEMERLVSIGYAEVRGVVLFRRTTSGLPMEGIL